MCDDWMEGGGRRGFNQKDTPTTAHAISYTELVCAAGGVLRLSNKLRIRDRSWVLLVFFDCNGSEVNPLIIFIQTKPVHTPNK